MRLSSVIRRRLKDYTVEIPSGVGQIINGRYVETPVIGQKKLFIIQLTYELLKFLPDGAYTIKDIKVYEVGKPSLQTGCIIHYKGSRYEVSSEADREKDGNFSSYFAKRLVNK